MKLTILDIYGQTHEYFVDDAKPLSTDTRLGSSAYKLFDKKFVSGLGVAILDEDNKSLSVIDNKNNVRAYYNLRNIVKFEFSS